MQTVHEPPTPWKTRLAPMPAQTWPIAYRRVFSADEVRALRDGLWPDDMDGRWVIWLDGDNLRLWRSWTGTCIYQLDLRETEDGGAEARVALVLDTDDYRRSPTEEGEIHRLAGVLSLVLNQERVGS